MRLYIWEWRRRMRQFIRNVSPRTKLTYDQWSKRRLIMSFVMFCVGWKIIGMTITEAFIFEKHPETGETTILSLEEIRKRYHERSEALWAKRQLPNFEKPFSLDDADES